MMEKLAEAMGQGDSHEGWGDSEGVSEEDRQLAEGKIRQVLKEASQKADRSNSWGTVPAEMQGRSLRPILAGQRPADWRTSFYYQYFEWPRPHHVRPHYGVITDRYKLVHFFGTADDYWELYDREKDPNELRNVLGDPAYAATKVELEKELARLRRPRQHLLNEPPKVVEGRHPR